MAGSIYSIDGLIPYDGKKKKAKIGEVVPARGDIDLVIRLDKAFAEAQDRNSQNFKNVSSQITNIYKEYYGSDPRFDQLVFSETCLLRKVMGVNTVAKIEIGKTTDEYVEYNGIGIKNPVDANRLLMIWLTWANMDEQFVSEGSNLFTYRIIPSTFIEGQEHKHNIAIYLDNDIVTRLSQTELSERDSKRIKTFGTKILKRIVPEGKKVVYQFNEKSTMLEYIRVEIPPMDHSYMGMMPMNESMENPSTNTTIDTVKFESENVENEIQAYALLTAFNIWYTHANALLHQPK